MAAGEICILAGGLSTRMGRNKARLRLDGKTLLRHVQDASERTSWPVRIIRRDLVKRCGPLGGVYTALKTTKADRVLFLACDMPFVSKELLKILIDVKPPKSGAIFSSARLRGQAGFPFLLETCLLPKVEELLAQKSYSLQSLAKVCRAKTHIVPSAEIALFNVNIPADWKQARARWPRSCSIKKHDTTKRP